MEVVVVVKDDIINGIINYTEKVFEDDFGKDDLIKLVKSTRVEISKYDTSFLKQIHNEKVVKKAQKKGPKGKEKPRHRLILKVGKTDKTKLVVNVKEPTPLAIFLTMSKLLYTIVADPDSDSFIKGMSGLYGKVDVITNDPLGGCIILVINYKQKLVEASNLKSSKDLVKHEDLKSIVKNMIEDFNEKKFEMKIKYLLEEKNWIQPDTWPGDNSIRYKIHKNFDPNSEIA